MQTNTCFVVVVFVVPIIFVISLLGTIMGYTVFASNCTGEPYGPLVDITIPLSIVFGGLSLTWTCAWLIDRLSAPVESYMLL